MDHVTLDPGDSAPESEPSFTPHELRLVRRAVATADSIISDPAYRRHLTELQARNAIDWRSRQHRLVPRNSRGRPTAWFLARFSDEGNFSVSEIHATEADSTIPTSAWTSACKPSRCPLKTYLNPHFIRLWERAYPYGLTNTVIHERVHAFGLKHGRGQTRWPNVCDLAYVAGDLAEVMLRHRAAGAAVDEDPEEPLCPALREHLQEAGILVD